MGAGCIKNIVSYLAKQTEWEDENIARLDVSVDHFVHVQEGKSTRNLIEIR